jgi:hypothetical protein
MKRQIEALSKGQKWAVIFKCSPLFLGVKRADSIVK